MAEENNANPVFETVPIEETKKEQPNAPNQAVETVIPEEIPEELTPEDLTGGSSEPPIDLPPLEDDSFGGDGGKRKYVFIGVGIFIFVVIFFMVLQFLLSLRGNDGDGGNKEVTLEYWALWEDPTVMVPVIEEYQKQHPNITINYIKQDPQSYREKLVARGKEGRGPDIFRFHNTWLPSIIEIAAPLPEKIMTNEEFESTFYEIAQKDLKVGSAYHGIPLMIDGLVLIYNDELFRKAGIVTVPQTWDDLIQAANTLRVQDTEGNIRTSGIALGTANNIEHFSDIFGWMLLQNGGDVRNLSSQEAVEVLANYRGFAEPPLNFWNENMPNNINAFVQGKVAMVIAPSWRILEMKAANSELDIKVANLPVLSGNQPLSLASYWVEGVSKSSENQTQAWQFLKYLSEQETMTKMYEEQAKTRLFGEPYSRVDLRDSLLQNEYIGPVMEQALFMESLPLVTRTFDNGLNDEIVTYLEDAINATVQGVSYEQALGTASQGVSQVLEKYNIE